MIHSSLRHLSTALHASYICLIILIYIFVICIYNCRHNRSLSNCWPGFGHPSATAVADKWRWWDLGGRDVFAVEESLPSDIEVINPLSREWTPDTADQSWSPQPQQEAWPVPGVQRGWAPQPPQQQGWPASRGQRWKADLTPEQPTPWSQGIGRTAGQRQEVAVPSIEAALLRHG